MNTRQIEQHFFDEIKKMNLQAGDKIGLGFSGGADSTLLLLLCEKFLPKNSFEVVYFAHGDNPLVDDDSIAIDFCKAAAKKINIDLKVIELQLEKTQAGWEGSGHNARKQYIMANYQAYFLGHHLDDKCENYFIQFMRGAGSAKILKSEATLKRPLLALTKEEIKSYLVEKNISWLEDKTNENTDITRNFWRQTVLPQIETHYPEYRERVSTALKVEEQNLSLIKDLAYIDGLDNLLQTNKIELSLNLPERRIKNLLYFYYKSQHVNTQNTTLDEVVRQILRPQKEIERECFGFKLKTQKSAKDNKLTIEMTPSPQLVKPQKPKF